MSQVLLLATICISVFGASRPNFVLLFPDQWRFDWVCRYNFVSVLLFAVIFLCQTNIFRQISITQKIYQSTHQHLIALLKMVHDLFITQLDHHCAHHQGTNYINLM